jgi:hypothetical protein
VRERRAVILDARLVRLRHVDHLAKQDTYPILVMHMVSWLLHIG